MWWMVAQTVRKEIHIYPNLEARWHVLDAELCNCMPEVKPTAAGRIVVHKKIGENYPVLYAHWIRG